MLLCPFCLLDSQAALNSELGRVGRRRSAYNNGSQNLAVMTRVTWTIRLSDASGAQSCCHNCPGLEGENLHTGSLRWVTYALAHGYVIAWPEAYPSDFIQYSCILSQRLTSGFCSVLFSLNWRSWNGPEIFERYRLAGLAILSLMPPPPPPPPFVSVAGLYLWQNPRKFLEI
jgi:hypothetical protein